MSKKIWDTLLYPHTCCKCNIWGYDVLGWCYVTILVDTKISDQCPASFFKVQVRRVQTCRSCRQVTGRYNCYEEEGEDPGGGNVLRRKWH